MAATESLNVADLLGQHLESASPDVLRAMVKTSADALMSAETDACAVPVYDERKRRADQLAQQRPSAGVGHLGWHGRAGDPEAAAVLVFS